jgi:hypothetical protein
MNITKQRFSNRTTLHSLLLELALLLSPLLSLAQSAPAQAQTATLGSVGRLGLWA